MVFEKLKIDKERTILKFIKICEKEMALKVMKNILSINMLYLGFVCILDFSENICFLINKMKIYQIFFSER